MLLPFLLQHIKGGADSILPVGTCITGDGGVVGWAVFNVACFSDTTVVPGKKFTQELHVLIDLFVY